MGMKRKQAQVVCNHCGNTFGSGAGLALHMRHVNGQFDYSQQGKRNNEIKPWSYRKAKKTTKLTLECKLDTCGNTFEVVPSQVGRRKYCCKSHAGLAQKGKRPPTSAAQRQQMSVAAKARYAANPESNPFYGRTPSNYRGWGKGGFEPELGFSVRSTWERDYLLGLKKAGVPFEYEPKRFSLGPGKGTYMPDIRLTPEVFVEITGWDKPGKAEKRHMFVEKYKVTLHVIKDRPTPETIQELVNFAKEVMQADD